MSTIKELPKRKVTIDYGDTSLGMQEFYADVLLHMHDIDGSQLIILRTAQRESVRKFVTSEMIKDSVPSQSSINNETPKIFGYIFDTLAENPTPKNKKIAKKVFEESVNYKFQSYSQMHADDSLIKLELAKVSKDPYFGEILIRKGDRGWSE